ncbi:hypothetical protein [Delftia acidovorans]
MNKVKLLVYKNKVAIEVTWFNEDDSIHKCRIYANSQMQELKADLGAVSAEHEKTIAEVAAAHLPTPGEPLSVPLTITRAQGKAALIQAGLWPQVLAFMAGIEDPNDKLLAEVALNDTVNWERSSPFLARVAAELGLTQQQLDELFIAAAAVVL